MKCTKNDKEPINTIAYDFYTQSIFTGPNSMGTPKNFNSDEALPHGFCGFVAEISLGGVFKNNTEVFRGSNKRIFENS